MKLLYSLLTPTDRKAQTTQRHQMPQGMESHGTYDSADVHLPVVKTNKKNSKRYLHIAIAMLMGTVSMGAMAADCINSTVPANDYKEWASGTNSGTIDAPHGLTITGTMNKVGGSIRGNNAQASPTGGALFIRADMSSKNDNNDIKLNFNKPLKNLNFSVYDIDRRNFFGWVYIDKVQFIGKRTTDDGEVIVYPTLKNKGSNVSITGDHHNIAYASGGECNTYDFDPSCRITAEFTEEITELQILYGNTDQTRSNPGSQNIEMTFDSYCVSGAEAPPPTDPTPTDPSSTSCPAGWVSDKFATSDYQDLVSSNNITYINGTKNESYLNARMQKNQIDLSSFSLTANNYFWIDQKISSNSGKSVFTYEFTNKFTGEKQKLQYLELNIGDIDYVDSYTVSSKYQDQVTVIGYAGDTSIIPTMIYQGTNIDGSAPTYYSKETTGCDNSDVYATSGDKCRLKLKFNKAIDRLKITYDNHSNIPWYRRTNQQLAIKFENYCYKPQPRLSFSKVLSGIRIKDTDQFTVKVTEQGSEDAVHKTSNTTTQGSGGTITIGTGTTGIFKVNPTKTYTLKEAAAGSTNLNNYTVTYKCTNADGSEIESTNPLNPKAFEMTYGQEWTCTVTNTPKKYVFEGTVFNDNAGIIHTSSEELQYLQGFPSQELNGDYANTDYFNGRLDDSEEGIYQNGLKVGLTDCEGHIIEEYSADVSNGSDNHPIGTYKIEVPYDELSSRDEVCLVEYVQDGSHTPTQMELMGKAKNRLTEYPVDTTDNSKKIVLSDTPNQLIYDGIDFGNVREIDTALVLIKRQYIYDCNNSTINLQEIAVNDALLPTQAFSSKGKNGENDLPKDFKIEPNQCIAYRIDVFNRGFIPLSGVSISDTIPANSILTTPAPAKIGQIKTVAENAGKITTNPNNSNDNLFDLPKRNSASNLSNKSNDAIFFNTKYNGN